MSTPARAPSAPKDVRERRRIRSVARLGNGLLAKRMCLIELAAAGQRLRQIPQQSNVRIDRRHFPVQGPLRRIVEFKPLFQAGTRHRKVTEEEARCSAGCGSSVKKLRVNQSDPPMAMVGGKPKKNAVRTSP